MSRKRLATVIALLALLLLAPGILLAGGQSQKESGKGAAASAGDLGKVDPWILQVREGLEKYRGSFNFKGPNGQTPTWDTELVLTLGEVEKIKSGNYKAVIAWHGSQGEYTDALGGGIKDGLKHLGIRLLGEASAEFDPAKQRSDVENLMAMNPDIVISLPTDSVTSVQTFKPVVEKGKKLVLISNQPQGYVHGKDFVGLSTSMPQDQGKFMAEAVLKATKSGEVGFIYYDADFWIVNYIDGVVEETLKKGKPDLKIYKKGFANPATDIENSALAILQTNPKVDALYVSFSAMGAAIACESLGRKDVKVVSQGLDKPYMQNMLSGGNIYAIITYSTYNIGVNTALMAGYGVLGKPAPEYLISPSATVTKGNLREMWKLAFRVVAFPQELEALMK
jgi:ribose transport system substrate-binding protein